MSDDIRISWKRNYSIDFIRALCLLLIILAHVDAPRIIQNIRCFDVVCLVFISGMSYEISRRRKHESYKRYMCRRIRKLLVPTYVLLTLIFGTVFVLNHSPQPIGLIKIIESYFLYDGIGYVWFVRVMLMLAAISPLILNVQQNLDNRQQVFFALGWVAAYVVAIAFYNLNILPFWPNLIFYNVIIFLLGYGMVYAFGMQYHKLKRQTKYIVVVVFALCCVGATMCGVGSAGTDKYPPGLLYLSYGGICSIVLYESFALLDIKSVPKSVLFLSTNSFYIYLFHIVPLLILKYSENAVICTINNSWVFQYVFVLVVTFGMTIICCLIRDKTNGRRKEKIT